MADFMDEDVILREIHVICWLLPSTYSSITSFPVASPNHTTETEFEEHSFAPIDNKLVEDFAICNPFKTEQENNIILGCASCFFRKDDSAVHTWNSFWVVQAGDGKFAKEFRIIHLFHCQQQWHCTLLCSWMTMPVVFTFK